MAVRSIQDHIETTQGVLGGKPRIAGRRISVHHIAVLHERLGMAADEIAAQHGLSLASVYAALSYYFEHREAIEAAAAADEEFVESFRKQVGSRIRRPD